MIRRTFLVALLAVAGVVAGAGALAGCGTDDGSRASRTTSGTAPRTTSTIGSSGGGPVLDAQPPARALVLGDSNLFESGALVDAALRRVGLEPTLEGIPSYGLKDLAEWRARLPALLATDPAIVVVALGTNDTATRADVEGFAGRLDEMMRALGDRPVVWVTHVDPRPFQIAGGAAAVNAAIRVAPERWPNLTVLDRTPELTADPSLLRDDALHFTPAGMRAFADAIADAASRRVAEPASGSGSGAGRVRSDVECATLSPCP